MINKLESCQIVDKIFWKNLNKEIVLESDSNLKYLIVSSWSDINLDFSVFGDWAVVEVYGIFLSKNKEEVRWNISVNLKNSSTKANVYLLSLMGDGAIIKVKW
jgi:23S rRNA G2069 N7-methylase RlmK/C1962 C5-methylase RlmI